MDPLAYLDCKLPPDGRDGICDTGSSFPQHVPWPTTNGGTLHVIACILARLERCFSRSKRGGDGKYVWTYGSAPGSSAFTFTHGTCVLLDYDGGRHLNGCPMPFHLFRRNGHLRVAALRNKLAERDQQFLMWHANMLIDLVQHLHPTDCVASSWVKSRLPLVARHCNTWLSSPPSPPPAHQRADVDALVRTCLARLLNFYADNGTSADATKISYTAAANHDAAWTELPNGGLEFFRPSTDESMLVLDPASGCFPFTVALPDTDSLSTFAADLHDNLHVQRHATATDADAVAAAQQLLDFIASR